MSTSGVRKTYQLHDEAKGVWIDIFEAPGIEGRLVTAEVPREEQSVRAVRRALLSKGADVEAIASDEIIQAAMATHAPVVRLPARTGWRDGNARFVSHRHVAGTGNGGKVVPPRCPLVGAAGQLQACGSLKGWQKLVKAARCSTTMTLALCAVFAAPLLALLNRPSFALVLFGPSKVGKSFAQLVAASALGFGREQDLPSLNATEAGLLAAALSFNDHMLPINEVGTVKGPKRDIYVALRDTTYSLMNGQDILRHPSWSGESGGAASTFQVIVLMSSEISPDAWAARNGEARDEGEMARMIGVPVLASGRVTIFDRPPAKKAGDQLAAWEKKQFKRLTQELPNERGVAIRVYLDALLRDVAWSQKRARVLATHFEDVIAKPSMSPIARDIVAKFGVLYAGGLLAVYAGVLTIEKEYVKNAVRRACLAALAELPDPAHELRADLVGLRERLGGGSIIDVDSSPRKALRLMRDADGYREPKGEGQLFVVRAQVFAGWFGTPLRLRRILEWLDDEGLLDHSRDRTNGRSNLWARKQVSWPDGTRVWSIVIFLPVGLADLDRLG